MTKSLRETLLERDQMYAEYLKDISLHIGGKLSKALSEVIFDNKIITIMVEDISVVTQNINYVYVVIVARLGNVDQQDISQSGNSISFAIPLEILDNGDSNDITEYLKELKNHQESEGSPISPDGGMEYVERIIDRVKKKAEGETIQEPITDHELDETQIALMKLTELKDTKH